MLSSPRPLPLLFTLLLPLPLALHAQATPPPVPALYSDLTFRNIGPAVTGGRIHDVEALPSDPATIWVATASGGLWKTENGGTTWRPLTDELPVSTFGDVAPSPSDPDVLWIGTGEQNNRQSTSYGNGVYRSTDGGETWTHLGLEDTRHIGKVIVHPRDPDVAWVAALGNLWAPGEARGVYKTIDGGATWEKVLFVDTLTGVVDLDIDPSNPDVLYAAAYQRMRKSFGFNGGGPGSGIYRSSDGGLTWRELTGGLPQGDMGRIGLAVAPSQPSRLYALVEALGDDEGTYRSDDGGDSWRKVNDLNSRPMYYSHIYVDPVDPDRVYALSQDVDVSDDGGATFRELTTRPSYDVGVHADHHALWIDPNDPSHFYLAGDGGFHETWDYGATYEKIDNFAIAQIYGMGVDNEWPYNVYIGLQDNHSWMGPSATRHWIGILNDDWRQIGFGDGMYHQVADIRHVFSTAQNGNVQRVDGITGDRLEVRPPEPEDEEYRYDWVTPMLSSAHDPTTIYIGGNRLFISHDLGETWQRTEDLTKAIDRDTMSIMGVPGSSDRILSENDGTSSNSEIVTIDESPLDGAILWVGTDDGNVQVSRDGGESWTEVGRNIPARPAPTTYVSRVTASPAGPGVAYVALDAHRDGDFSPYLYRTDDFGESWRPIGRDLPELGVVNEVIVHPDEPRLMFLGTEHALFVSVDAGESWRPFGANLPTTLYDDMLIHPTMNDLVVATHGRGVWVLDDVAPLVELADATRTAPVHLFSIRPAYIFQYWKDTSYRGQSEYAGENPVDGAIVSYYLGEGEGEGEGGGTATLVVTDASGSVVRRMEVSGSPGIIQRVNWDLRHGLQEQEREQEEQEQEQEQEQEENWAPFDGPPRPMGFRGPFVSPGRYTVTVTTPAGASAQATVEVRGDPLMPMLDEEDYEAREAFLVGLVDLMERLDPLADGETAEAEAADDLLDDAQDLYGDLNGGGVQQGSLYPPTPPMLEAKAEIERRASELLSGG
ncbi:MAG: WD40/YVTN/BNR-like repeat-containing protein [Longimicrobiales bacterium]